MEFTEVFGKSQKVCEYSEAFFGSKVEDFKISKEQKKIELVIRPQKFVKKNVIMVVAKDIRAVYDLNSIKIYTRYSPEMFSHEYYSEIVTYISLKIPALKEFIQNSEAQYADGILDIYLNVHGADMLVNNGASDEIKKLVADEFSMEIEVVFHDGDDIENKIEDYLEYREETLRDVIEEEMKLAEQRAEEQKKINKELRAEKRRLNQEEKENQAKYNMICGSHVDGETIPMKYVTQNSGKVILEGEIFYTDDRKTKNDSIIFTMYVTDGTSSVMVKKFYKNKEKFDDEKDSLKEGAAIRLHGEAMYDEYIKDCIVKPISIEKIEKKVRMDEAEEKRVELHLHTKMSAVDGVSDVQDLIKEAHKWGHKAIAITDHGVLQAYPEAYALGKKLGIKIIYGVEGYLVDDFAQIYSGDDDKNFEDVVFTVFDLETTGLSSENDRIIEIGAVKVKNGEVIEKYSKFVNPKRPLPEKIVELTNITEDMVENEPDETVIVPEFIEFIGDSVLVAHNANFDVGFLNSACKRLNIKFENTYLDTLDFARRIFPELKKHKLENIAHEANVKLEGAHRAVNDAECLVGVFDYMLSKVKEKGINSLKELNASLPKNVDSAKTYHCIILVKNHTGLINLYKLVSNSNLLHYKKRPRMLKSEMYALKEGLIYGSACEAGELYRAVLEGKKEEEIEKIASFYDFLEIQPLGNNQFMIENQTVKSKDDLIEINKKIIALGDKLGKMTVATGDVHFLNPEDSVYRKILMYGHGFKDADDQAPLYLRTTNEMLDEFYYLDDDRKYEIVVTNPNRISDMVDDMIVPIPEKRCPPSIPGAEEDLTNMSHAKAKRIYGDPLPKIVQERMDKELNSIISNGYAVMYIIAQKLVKKSLEDGYLVGSRGSVGSSFVAFLSDITEVNSLCPHYICPNCKHSEFIEDGSYSSGCDMPPKNCPDCKHEMIRDGHDIPFETFLGFEGDKEPDIDLNFSGDYQPIIHKYTEEIFGEGHVFRAGTIGTIAEKNAFGYVKKYCEEKGLKYNNAEMMRLSIGCNGVKKTTGQHPGGVMIVPKEFEVFDFTPIAHPADDPNSDIITTHFQYTYLHDCLLKLDLLGHDDPTIIRMLQDLTGIDPKSIPLDDEKTMQIFLSPEVLGVTAKDIDSEVGTLGIPEFGTGFTRQMLVDTKPTTFAELVRISGLSHGTDVWLGNAQELIVSGTCTLKDAICTRDDIMTYLIHKGLKPKNAFSIMESVRKGKVAKGKEGKWEQFQEEMRANDVPDWYIHSCEKIQYMFPKAHAVAYVTMAFRIAYFKVHYPLAYYATYFSVRAGDFDIDMMVGEKVEYYMEQYKKMSDLKQKDKNVITLLGMCNEMQKRGINFANVDLYKSDAQKFTIDGNSLRLPFTAIKGLGVAAAETVIEARGKEEFFSKEDLMARTKLSKTHIEQLEALGCLDGLPDSAQMSLFDM